MRLKLIACEILFREICFCAARTKNIVDIMFLEKGLHDIGECKMSARLQEEIDMVDVRQYDAVALAYGLCNNGIRGLHAGIPLAVPRAHDCITLLLGSKERYQKYFNANPGTYFASTGWLERDKPAMNGLSSVPNQLGIDKSYEDYAAQYGEENAQYFLEIFGSWTRHYTKLTYIDMHIGDFEHYAEQTRERAKQQGWQYERIDGSTDLLMRLLDGEWNEEDFLVLEPKHRIIATTDEHVIGAKKAP